MPGTLPPSTGRWPGQLSADVTSPRRHDGVHLALEVPIRTRVAPPYERLHQPKELRGLRQVLPGQESSDLSDRAGLYDGASSIGSPLPHDS